MHATEIAVATPASRDRVVDFWRVAAIAVVVLGHWLAASIWLRPDGGTELRNALEWIPYGAWITWVVQVMPVFFLVGGFANARGLRHVEAGRQTRQAWTAVRARRLIAPTIPLLVVWVGLVAAVRPLLAPEVVHAGAIAATVPLWFLAVYLVVTAVAPWTHDWWRRAGLRSILLLASAAIAVDAVRFAFDATAVGFLNYLFVWGTVHQLGYWWADRGERFRSVATGWALAGGALVALVAVTSTGLYPVATLGIGPGTTNVTPPTAVLLLLALFQVGVVLATLPAVQRLTRMPLVWTAVVAVSGRIMTLYLWHLSAMALVAAVGLRVADGAALRLEPGDAVWWLTRPVWVAVLAAVTALLVALFGRFERPPTAAPPDGRWATWVGLVLCAGSLAVVAHGGLSTPQAAVNWSPVVAAAVGAVLAGALPADRGGRTR